MKKSLQKGVAAGDIQNTRGLKKLAIFLISNMASEYSFDTLKKVSGIENEETISSYLDYLEDIFLLYRVPKLNSLQENGMKKMLPVKFTQAIPVFSRQYIPITRTALG